MPVWRLPPSITGSRPHKPSSLASLGLDKVEICNWTNNQVILLHEGSIRPDTFLTNKRDEPLSRAQLSGKTCICLRKNRASPRLLYPLPKARFACLGPIDHGSYLLKGFQDWFMFSRSKHGLKIETWLKHPLGALKCTEIYQDRSIGNENTSIPIWITASNGSIFPPVFSEIWCQPRQLPRFQWNTERDFQKICRPAVRITWLWICGDNATAIFKVGWTMPFSA